MKVKKVAITLEDIAKTQGCKENHIPLSKIPFICSVLSNKVCMVGEPQYHNGMVYFKTTLQKEDVLKKLADHHDTVVSKAEYILQGDCDQDNPNFYKDIELIRSQSKLDSKIGAAVFNADKELGCAKKAVIYVDRINFTFAVNSSAPFSQMNVTCKKHGLNAMKVDISELTDEDRHKLYALINPIIKVKDKKDKSIRLVLLITKNKLGKICLLKLLPEFIDEFAHKQSSRRIF